MVVPYLSTTKESYPIYLKHKHIRTRQSQSYKILQIRKNLLNQIYILLDCQSKSKAKNLKQSKKYSLLFERAFLILFVLARLCSVFRTWMEFFIIIGLSSSILDSKARPSKNSTSKKICTFAPEYYSITK